MGMDENANNDNETGVESRCVSKSRERCKNTTKTTDINSREFTAGPVSKRKSILGSGQHP